MGDVSMRARWRQSLVCSCGAARCNNRSARFVDLGVLFQPPVLCHTLLLVRSFALANLLPLAVLESHEGLAASPLRVSHSFQHGLEHLLRHRGVLREQLRHWKEHGEHSTGQHSTAQHSTAGAVAAPSRDPTLDLYSLDTCLDVSSPPWPTSCFTSSARAASFSSSATDVRDRFSATRAAERCGAGAAFAGSFALPTLAMRCTNAMSSVCTAPST